MVSRSKIVSAVAAAAAFLAMGCSVVEGNGVRRADVRAIPAADELEIRAVDARVVVDADFRGSVVEVHGDGNLVPLVRTRMEGHRLVVDTEEDVSPRVPLEIILRTGSLRAIDATGGAKIDVSIDAGSMLAIEASGGARIVGHGNVDRLEADLAGGATLDTRDLVARDVDLDVAGGANASVCATGVLDVDVAGGANASYVCSPHTIRR